MKTFEAWFARRLDRLSGTYPNDERTSRINEKGFALCGLFYFFALAVRSVRVILANRPFVNLHRDPATTAPAVFGIMILLMLCITVRQRRKEAPAAKKTSLKLHPAELPRAAAALLSGKSPSDERTVLAFERGFAVCGLLGIAYYGFCCLFIVWCWYFFSSFLCLFAAPLLLAYVKLRKNILTPPRSAHIPLNTKHLLLRLPVYALAAFPFFFIVNFFPTVYDTLGNISDESVKFSSDLFMMFLQMLGMSFKAFFTHPVNVSSASWLYYAAAFLIIAIFREFTVWIFRKQMIKMDAEENDLS